MNRIIMKLKNFKNRIFILIIIFIVFIISFYFVFLNFNKNEILDIENEVSINEVKENIEIKENFLLRNKENVNSKIEVLNNNTVENAQNIKKKIVLSVLNQNYEIDFKENDASNASGQVSLFKIMQRLEQEQNFNFKYKEYPALGVFVEEINGVRGENGKYWIYSVNGKEGEVGISKYVLRVGDIISWELK